MKMRGLLRRAYEILKTEHAHVYDDFKEDDGTFKGHNKELATRLKQEWGQWLADAEKVLGIGQPRSRGARTPRKKTHKIVVQKRSELE